MTRTYKKKLVENPKDINVSPIQKDITLSKYKVKEHTDSYNEYSTLKGECPTCHQDIDEDFVKEKIEYHSAKITHYTEDLVDNLSAEKEEGERVNTDPNLVSKRRIEDWEDLFRDLDKNTPK